MTDNVGAGVTVTRGIQNAVNSLRTLQNRSGEALVTMWVTLELICLQLSLLWSSLHAAETVIPGATNSLPNALGFINGTKAGNGGHGYNDPENNNHAMTASGAWTYLLAGASSRMQTYSQLSIG